MVVTEPICSIKLDIGNSEVWEWVAFDWQFYPLPMKVPSQNHLGCLQLSRCLPLLAWSWYVCQALEQPGRRKKHKTLRRIWPSMSITSAVKHILLQPKWRTWWLIMVEGNTKKQRDDSYVFQVCSCLLVSGLVNSPQFIYLIPVTEGQGGHGTSSCSRTGRSRRLRAMLAERNAKTGGAGIQLADVGTLWY